MKTSSIKIILSCIVLLTVLFMGTYRVNALTSGETYTISVEKMESNGSLSSVGTPTTSTADSDGKIAFSLSGIPDNNSCNFLVITVKDSSAATVRRSASPCPNPGTAVPVGVSGLTNAQTDALLAAIASAGTDDPILAVFGYAIVRSTAVTASELTYMANVAYQAINGAGGYIDYLTSNGVSSSTIATYKKKIVIRIADTSDGYSKKIKDSVDAATDTEKLNARGEAASMLLLVLVQAATDAGFSQDLVLTAFNAMGVVVEPLMAAGIAGGDLSAATAQMINSSIGGGIQKLKADKEIEKYSAALTTLGASGSDVTNYQTAATTLMNAMKTAFQTFEQVFDGTETDSDIQTAQTAMDAAMDTAFGQFMTDTAASNARITTMVSNIDTALGAATGLTVSDFQFYKSNGSSVNWPLTMVILTDWISSNVSNGGAVAYTRSTDPADAAIPNDMEWVGSCSAGGHTNRTDCEGASETWNKGRTDFTAGMPASYASIFGIQEDIMILEFVRWAAQSSAGSSMAAHEALEQAFSDSIDALPGNISGTTDGSTAISASEKQAIVTLLKSPQF